jgi:hypothetical protein
MFRLTRLALVLLLVALVFVPFSQAAPDPQVRSLQRQVKTLTAQVRMLTTAVKTLQGQAAADRQRAQDRDDCLWSLTQDEFGNYFHELAAVVAFVTGSPPAKDLPRWDDKGACQRAGVTRPGP